MADQGALPANTLAGQPDLEEDERLSKMRSAYLKRWREQAKKMDGKYIRPAGASADAFKPPYDTSQLLEDLFCIPGSKIMAATLSNVEHNINLGLLTFNRLSWDPATLVCNVCLAFPQALDPCQFMNVAGDAFLEDYFLLWPRLIKGSSVSKPNLIAFSIESPTSVDESGGYVFDDNQLVIGVMCQFRLDPEYNRDDDFEDLMQALVAYAWLDSKTEWADSESRPVGLIKACDLFVENFELLEAKAIADSRSHSLRETAGDEGKVKENNTWQSMVRKYEEELGVDVRVVPSALKAFFDHYSSPGLRAIKSGGVIAINPDSVPLQRLTNDEREAVGLDVAKVSYPDSLVALEKAFNTSVSEDIHPGMTKPSYKRGGQIQIENNFTYQSLSWDEYRSFVRSETSNAFMALNRASGRGDICGYVKGLGAWLNNKKLLGVGYAPSLRNPKGQLASVSPVRVDLPTVMALGGKLACQILAFLLDRASLVSHGDMSSESDAMAEKNLQSRLVDYFFQDESRCLDTAWLQDNQSKLTEASVIELISQVDLVVLVRQQQASLLEALIGYCVHLGQVPDAWLLECAVFDRHGEAGLSLVREKPPSLSGVFSGDFCDQEEFHGGACTHQHLNRGVGRFRRPKPAWYVKLARGENITPEDFKVDKPRNTLPAGLVEATVPAIPALQDLLLSKRFLGMTPLMVAAAHGQLPSMLSIIRSLGPSAFKAFEQSDGDGKTAFDWFVRFVAHEKSQSHTFAHANLQPWRDLFKHLLEHARSFIVNDDTFVGSVVLTDGGSLLIKQWILGELSVDTWPSNPLEMVDGEDRTLVNDAQLFETPGGLFRSIFLDGQELCLANEAYKLIDKRSDSYQERPIAASLIDALITKLQPLLSVTDNYQARLVFCWLKQQSRHLDNVIQKHLLPILPWPSRRMSDHDFLLAQANALHEAILSEGEAPLPWVFDRLCALMQASHTFADDLRRLAHMQDDGTEQTSLSWLRQWSSLSRNQTSAAFWLLVPVEVSCLGTEVLSNLLPVFKSSIHKFPSIKQLFSVDHVKLRNQMDVATNVLDGMLRDAKDRVKMLHKDSVTRSVPFADRILRITGKFFAPQNHLPSDFFEDLLAELEVLSMRLRCLREIHGLQTKDLPDGQVANDHDDTVVASISNGL